MSTDTERDMPYSKEQQEEQWHQEEERQEKYRIERRDLCRKELAQEIKLLSALPLDERRLAVLDACDRNLFAELCSQDDIIAKAYVAEGSATYWDQTLSETMTVWEFGLVFSVHSASSQEPWIIHKKTMAGLCEAARQIRIDDLASTIFLGDADELANLPIEKVHPLAQTGPLRKTRVHPARATKWFALDPSRKNLVPPALLGGTNTTPRRDHTRNNQAARRRAISEALLSLYPEGRPALGRGEMITTLKGVLKYEPSDRTLGRALKEAWGK